jgi:hypothetical protein
LQGYNFRVAGWVTFGSLLEGSDDPGHEPGLVFGF